MPARWTDELLVGIDVVDNQHKALVNALVKLGNALWDGEGKVEAVPALNFLIKYGVVHFADEEKVMEAYGYPLLDDHKRLHKKFVEDVLTLKQKVDSEPMTSELAILIFNNTWDWLVNHIRKADQAFGVYVKSKA